MALLHTHTKKKEAGGIERSTHVCIMHHLLPCCVCVIVCEQEPLGMACPVLLFVCCCLLIVDWKVKKLMATLCVCDAAPMLLLLLLKEPSHGFHDDNDDDDECRHR